MDLIGTTLLRSLSIEDSYFRREGEIMFTGVLLAKSLTDLTFGGAFLWYLVKFLISGGLAFVAILLGIRLRKSKNLKMGSSESKEA